KALETLLGGPRYDLGDGVAVLVGVLGEQPGEVALQCLGSLAPVEVDTEGGEELGQLGQWSTRGVWDSSRFHALTTNLTNQSSVDKVVLPDICFDLETACPVEWAMASGPWGQTEFQVNLKLGLTPRSLRADCFCAGGMRTAREGCLLAWLSGGFRLGGWVACP